MRNIIAPLLIAISFLILATACSSQSIGTQGVGASNAIIRHPKIVTAVPDKMSLADCELQFTGTQPLESWPITPEEVELLYEHGLGNTRKANSPLDTDTATLEQILERSRLAMGDIVTYKACGTSVDRASTDQEFNTGSFNFTTVHSYDHNRTVMKDSVHDGGQFWEFLSLGPLRLFRNSEQGWQETSAHSTVGMQPIPPSVGLAGILYEDDIELISANETADNGEKVFRLAYTKMYDGTINEEEVRTARTISVLISHETFRMISNIQENYPNFESPSGSSQESVRVDWWLKNIHTTHYYDYNLPIILEAPDDYVPWQETVMTR